MTRTPQRHPMTPAKLAALRLLAIRSRITTKRTEGEFIGGMVAYCLVREGLARRTLTAYYEITEAGREALRLAEEMP